MPQTARARRSAARRQIRFIRNCVRIYTFFDSQTKSAIKKAETVELRCPPQYAI